MVNIGILLPEPRVLNATVCACILYGDARVQHWQYEIESILTMFNEHYIICVIVKYIACCTSGMI